MTRELEALFEPIKKHLRESQRDYVSLLGRFDKLVAHANHMEHELNKLKGRDIRSADTEEENESLREFNAYLMNLLSRTVEVAGMNDDEVRGEGAEKLRSVREEFADICAGNDSMRVEAWLKMNYVERWEFEKEVDRLVSEHQEELDATILNFAVKTSWFRDGDRCWCPRCNESWFTKDDERHIKNHCEWSERGPE